MSTTQSTYTNVYEKENVLSVSITPPSLSSSSLPVKKVAKKTKSTRHGVKRKVLPLPYNRKELAEWAKRDVEMALELINDGSRHTGMQILQSLETRNKKLNHYHRKYVISQQTHPNYESDMDDKEHDDDDDKVKSRKNLSFATPLCTTYVYDKVQEMNLIENEDGFEYDFEIEFRAKKKFKPTSLSR